MDSASATGAYAAVAALRSPVPNADSIAIDADGVATVLNASGQLLYGADQQPLNELAVVGAEVEAFADGTLNGSAIDTGLLVSAAAAANQHGLPVNFGPGRGNWTENDVARLQVDVKARTITAPIDASAIPPVVSVQITGGDVVIVVKNMSTAQVYTDLLINLKYSHSIEG